MVSGGPAGIRIRETVGRRKEEDRGCDTQLPQLFERDGAPVRALHHLLHHHNLHGNLLKTHMGNCYCETIEIFDK